MDWKSEWKSLAIIVIVFIGCFFLPMGNVRFENGIKEALYLVKWYAREHVVLCLIPAFFIAGAISVFVSQASVLKYLGAKANKVLSYGVASVSGSVLAVCSCTVLPLFAGIYKMGAGVGPATAFLYSGPAINVLAIILTARVLGLELGTARAVGAVIFSIIIGLLMHFFFRKEELEKAQIQAAMPGPEVKRALWKNVIYFGVMIAILVFANWGKGDENTKIWNMIYSSKWLITSVFSIGLGFILIRWLELEWHKVTISAAATGVSAIFFYHEPMIPFAVGLVGLSVITSTHKGEAGDWFSSSWTFAKQILPLLLGGIIVAGALLGRPGEEGFIPAEWIASLVGGNSFFANFFASIVGAFMYFATLTEIPILQGLIGSGMGKGPALALLLAGPALSLPSMLVIRSIMGTKKTLVFILLVIIMATLTGMIFGAIYK
ncbi:permease [bacterium]|nr:permease [bacterium]